MKKGKRIIVSLLASSAIALSGVWHHSQASEEGGRINAEQLFERKCSICHSISRPKSKKKSKQGWTSTVMRMKNKNGCPITDEEAEAIINYLAEKFGT